MPATPKKGSARDGREIPMDDHGLFPTSGNSDYRQRDQKERIAIRRRVRKKQIVEYAALVLAPQCQ